MKRKYLVALYLVVASILIPAFTHGQTTLVCNTIESCSKAIAELQKQLTSLRERQNQNTEFLVSYF